MLIDGQTVCEVRRFRMRGGDVRCLCVSRPSPAAAFSSRHLILLSLLTMSGTILERLSNRKLSVVIGIIVAIQLISFFVGAIFGKVFMLSF